MVNKKKIKEDIKENKYKRDDYSSPIEQENENKLKALDYYNYLSDGYKLQFQEELRKKKIRENYANYVQYVFGDNYIMTNFHKLLCSIGQDACNKIKEGKQARYLLSVPPQFGKSVTLTETLPSWFIGNNPDLSVIITAYNADIAEKFGDRNRTKVKDFGKEIFGVQISDSQDSKTLFQIKGHQGQVFSTGILGGLTSNPAALIIVDDPFKNGEEAENQDIRDKVERVYWDSIDTRARALGSAIIVIHTRWHEDDLIGRLSKKKGFYVINIPTVWESGVDKLLHRKVGEVLAPELGHSAEWAENKRVNVGSRVWNALYQGKPFIEGGNLVQRKDLKFYNKKTIPIVFEEITMSCDLSFGGTKTNNDPSCITVWGRVGGNHYLLNVVNKKMTFTDTLNSIQHLCQQYPFMRKKIVEAKANGNATIEMLNSKIGGFIPFNPKSDSKETRLRIVVPFFEAGNIFFPDESVEPNIEEYIDQLLKFPNCAHDDFVDTCSQYLLNYSYKYDYGKISTDSRFAIISRVVRGFKI